MTTTVTSICNEALLKLGAESITSLVDGTRNAQICSRAYDSTRLSLLRAHPWNFAMRRANLASSVGTPESEFTYKYLLPTDCIRLWRLVNLNIVYRLEGRHILCNETSIDIIYIYDNEDESTFDVSFSEVLSCKLAANIGYNITGDKSLAGFYADMYDRLLRQAKQNDAQENQAEKMENGSWADARFKGSRNGNYWWINE